MNRIKLKSIDEINTMRRGGAIVSSILNDIIDFVDEGIKTIDIDKKAEDLCKKNKVLSGTKGYMGYPASISVSINDELVHGIPSDHNILKRGDIVKLDMVIIYEEYYLDHAKTIVLGGFETISKKDASLVNVAELATNKAILNCKDGKNIGDVSYTMQSIVELAGFNVSRQMIGHGIGKNMHEEPEIPCFGFPGEGPKIVNGMTMAIETMAMSGDYELVIDADDGWTARTEDSSNCAHFEHTVAVVNNKATILTRE